MVKENNRKVNFIMLGGEPIIQHHLPIFKKVIFTLKKEINLDIFCISNGLEICDNIQDVLKLQISDFQLTLDGTEIVHNKRRPSKNPAKNSFQEICRAVEFLLKNSIRVSLRINIDEKNVEEIAGLADIIHKKGWNQSPFFTAYLYPVTFNGNDESKKYLSEEELLRRVIEVLEKNNIVPLPFFLDFHGLDFIDTIINKEVFIPRLKFCDASNEQFVFLPDRKIYSCWWGNTKNFELGHIGEQQIIWNDLAKSIWQSRSVENISECKSCKYKYLCGAGCSFKAEKKYQTIMKGNCSAFKTNIELYLKYLISQGGLSDGII